MKKVKSLLIAGAIAALPLALAALAQQSPSQPSQMSSETTETKITTITGTVQTYNAGKTITIMTPGGDPVTYNIIESSEVPKDLTVGKTVTVTTTKESGSPVVKTITVTTTTKKKAY